MKTILSSPLKAFLYVLAASLSLQQVYAQTAMFTSKPITTVTPDKDQLAAKPSIDFQTIAFPTQHASKIKVIIEDLTGNGAVIVIRNTDGQIFHQINCSDKGLYARIFNLSSLPDGEYSIEIMALSKVGFVRDKYIHTFKLQSTTVRSIAPWNKDLEKSLFTPRHAQVSR